MEPAGEMTDCKLLKTWWPGTELNRRRQPFQGCALPPELPGRLAKPAVCGIERYPLDAVVAGLPTEPNESVAGSVWNALDYSNGTEFAQCRRLDDKRQSAIKHIGGTRSVRLAWRADCAQFPAVELLSEALYELDEAP